MSNEVTRFNETQKEYLGERFTLVTRSKVKACSLDPSPPTIMKEYYSELVPVFKTIINLSLSTGVCQMTRTLPY